tara:strand:+ start:424 stop:708 length:285 start_codon:yes stop_codon:yes gene_type:complete
MKNKTENKKEFKINNSKKEPLWYKIKCICNKKNPNESYPFRSCMNCKYQQAENSLPKSNFNQVSIDKKGKETLRIINEITIVRGSHDDIIGWTF